MRRLIAWLWLVPVPLTFGFDLLTGTGWPVIAGTVLAAAAVLPILVRIHAGRTPSRALWIAVLGLLVSLGFVAIAATLSLTVLWLSLITLALLGRFGARPRASVAMVVLALANITVAGMLPDGLIFGLVSTIVIIVAISIGLMQRFTDRSLVERRATAAEAERRRIATELHDVIAHEITGIVVLAQAAGRSDNAQLTSTALGRIEASGTRALDEIRRLVSETRIEAASRTPIADGPQALRDRVESFGDRAQIAIDVGAIDDEAVWPVLDRVLVETLTNVRRHAGPDAPVTVQVTASEDAPRTLQMSVRNGPGTGGIGTGSGTGLSSLRERVSHLGGTIEAGPEGDGWTVRTCLPLTTKGDDR